ncbi:MAG TPA: hypothetical protein VF530_23435 [Planctomycetota bacterium]
MKTTVSILLSLPLLLPLMPAGPGAASATAPAPRTAAPPALPLAFSSVERTDLALAEQASMHELLDLRGGDVTNDNLWTILLVLGIIVLVLILI